MFPATTTGANDAGSSRTNAICLPSGDHEGRESARRVRRDCRGREHDNGSPAAHTPIAIQSDDSGAPGPACVRGTIEIASDVPPRDHAKLCAAASKPPTGGAICSSPAAAADTAVNQNTRTSDPSSTANASSVGDQRGVDTGPESTTTSRPDSAARTTRPRLSMYATSGLAVGAGATVIVDHASKSFVGTRQVPPHRAHGNAQQLRGFPLVQVLPVREHDHRALAQAQAGDRLEHLGPNLGIGASFTLCNTRFSRAAAHRRAVVHARLVQHAGEQVRALIAYLGPLRRRQHPCDRVNNDVGGIRRTHESGRESHEVVAVLAVELFVRQRRHTPTMPPTADSPDPAFYALSRWTRSKRRCGRHWTWRGSRPEPAAWASAR
jgi:hypothetical protein